MLEKLTVPTKRPKQLLKKYFTPQMHLAGPTRTTKKTCPNYRTVLCKYFSLGKCTRGEHCMFSHDPDLVQDALITTSEALTKEEERPQQPKQLFFSPFQ